MSMTFTKLFSSITESTVWCEDAPTRIVWITMLAMADKRGRVWASVPGLANRARVTVDECRVAIEKFLSPDADSRTSDHEGRRIEPIDGGWRLLNHAKYRDIRDEEERRAYKTAKQREYRHSVDNVDNCGQPWTEVDAGGHNAEADTEAEKEEHIPEGLNQSAWDDYVNHRKDLRAKRLTPKGRQIAMRNLAALPHDDQRTVVDTSISNGWQGLFPKKVKNETHHKQSFDDKLANLRKKAGLNESHPSVDSDG